MAKAKIKMRTPSIKKSVSARTTGRITRAAKSSVNPLYGKKGMGYLKDPGKAVKNSIYHKTTIGLSDVHKARSSGGRSVVGNSNISSGFIKEDIQKDIRKEHIEMPRFELGMFSSIMCALLSALLFIVSVVSFLRGQAVTGILFAVIGVLFVRPLLRQIKK